MKHFFMLHFSKKTRSQETPFFVRLGLRCNPCRPYWWIPTTHVHSFVVDVPMPMLGELGCGCTGDDGKVGEKIMKGGEKWWENHWVEVTLIENQELNIELFALICLNDIASNFPDFQWCLSYGSEAQGWLLARKDFEQVATTIKGWSMCFLCI